MKSRLRWMVLGAIAPLGLIAVAMRLPARGGSPPPDHFVTRSDLSLIAMHVDLCGNVVSKAFALNSTYSAARTQAVNEARQVEDSIQRAAQPGGGRGAPPPVVTPQAQIPFEYPTELRADSAVKWNVKLNTAIIANSPAAAAPMGEAVVSHASGCGSFAMPEFQDFQRIINSDHTFGPQVQLTTLDEAMDLRTPTDFESGYVLVALAALTKDDPPVSGWYPMGDGYARMNLVNPVNCVYLRHTPSAARPVVDRTRAAASDAGGVQRTRNPRRAPIDRGRLSASANLSITRISIPTPEEGWDAIIGSANERGACNDTSLANGRQLQVIGIGDTPIDSIPPAARFIEGRSWTSMIGVKCGSGYCVIGQHPREEMQPAIHSTANSEPHAPGWNRRVTNALWFDEQHLAVFERPDSKRLVPSQFRASVVPDTGLQNPLRNYQDNWYPMAYIYAKDSPPQKYADGLGLRKGWNEIRFRQINGIWFSMIVDANGKTHVRDIQAMAHTFGDVPGTVRWDWLDTDDLIWVPCSDGCCLIQDGRDS